VCFSALHCIVALCCTVLQCDAVNCSVVKCETPQHRLYASIKVPSVLRCVAVHCCIMLQNVAGCCSVMQCELQCNIMVIVYVGDAERVVSRTKHV